MQTYLSEVSFCFHHQWSKNHSLDNGGNIFGGWKFSLSVLALVVNLQFENTPLFEALRSIARETKITLVPWSLTKWTRNRHDKFSKKFSSLLFYFQCGRRKCNSWHKTVEKPRLITLMMAIFGQQKNKFSWKDLTWWNIFNILKNHF